jgi:ribose transport system permease protein
VIRESEVSVVSEPSVSSVAPAADVTVRPKRRRASEWLEAYALLACLVVAAVFFSVYGPTSGTFLTAANLRVLVGGQAVVALVALAALIPMCAGNWDLSVGATAGVGAVFSASVMSSGSLVAAVIFGIGLGAAIGVFNALVVTRFKINAVIATLGTLSLLQGMISMKTSGVAVVSNIPQSLTDLGSGTWAGIPRIAVVLLAVALATHYLLEHTPYGRYLYALGENLTAARLVGLRTNVLGFTTFVVAGVLAAIGGILAVARSGGASPQLGDQLLLPAFAAAFLSAAAIKPGRYNVLGLLVAVYFLAVINNGLNLMGAQPYVSSFVNGAALIIGVGMATYFGRKRSGA